MKPTWSSSRKRMEVSSSTFSKGKSLMKATCGPFLAYEHEEAAECKLQEVRDTRTLILSPDGKHKPISTDTRTVRGFRPLDELSMRRI